MDKRTTPNSTPVLARKNKKFAPSVSVLPTQQFEFFLTHLYAIPSYLPCCLSANIPVLLIIPVLNVLRTLFVKLL